MKKFLGIVFLIFCWNSVANADNEFVGKKKLKYNFKCYNDTNFSGETKEWFGLDESENFQDSDGTWLKGRLYIKHYLKNYNSYGFFEDVVMGGDYHVWYEVYDDYLYHNFLFQEAPKSIMAFYKSKGINVVDDENTYFHDMRAYKVPSQKKSEFIELLNERDQILDMIKEGAPRALIYKSITKLSKNQLMYWDLFLREKVKPQYSFPVICKKY